MKNLTCFFAPHSAKDVELIASEKPGGKIKWRVQLTEQISMPEVPVRREDETGKFR